ncbi:nickel uptake transporter family protein [Burkholderiales bacterium JOSHI_001]|nr:nickel uptake transporter family protein [Burkholderiales bacterium JOSHI_001]
MKSRLAVLLLALASASARAHDTWFEVQPGSKPGELRLALGTGSHFPQRETTIGGASLVAAQCRDGRGATQALQVQRDTERALYLRASAPPGLGLSCWAQQAQQQVTLPPDKIKLYLDEIRATDTVRDRWAGMAARGLTWEERYTKNARIEWGASTPQALPLALDIVPDSPAPRAGDILAFTVLRQGQPLPQFAVQLVNGASGLGLWLRTDDAGRAQVRLPLAGPWLLRGTDLRPDPQRLDAWESDFVTLAFSVATSAL